MDYSVFDKMGTQGPYDANQQSVPGSDLHDHDWRKIGGDFTFTSAELLRVSMAVPPGTEQAPNYGCADATMLLPRWPKLSSLTLRHIVRVASPPDLAWHHCM